jgi:hypothetical protein
MTRDQARQLRRGDRVMFLAPHCESVGTVIEANYISFVVHWEKAYHQDHFYHYRLYGDEKDIRWIQWMNC